MPQPLPSLPIEAAAKALAAAEAAGIPRQALFAAAGIDDAGARIGFASLCALYEQAARLTGDDAFGLHVGELTAPRMYGSLGYIVANSASLDDALVSLARYQPLWTRAAGVEVRRRRDGASLRYWHKGDVPPEARRQESEQMLAALLVFVRQAAGIALNPTEIRFEHRAPADLGEHRRIFGAPIRFRAAATEIVFAAATLALPIPEADATLARLMREQAQSALAEQGRREPFADQLRDRVKAAILAAEPVSMSTLAAAMGIGARTLQRRLRRHGLTFRAVAEGARIALARELLAEPGLALARIAFRLGYSQTSAFHRAFRRYAGMTPGAFRRALTAHEERF
jgi:AraC-like DNA-binding protein